MKNKFDLLKENEALYAEIISSSKKEADEILLKNQKKIEDLENKYIEKLEKKKSELNSKSNVKIDELIKEIIKQNKKELENINKINISDTLSDKVIKEVFDI